jgi:hypothetical protein
MSKYRTAMGKMLDMSILSSKNEMTRAVGNLKVNARGDTIDAEGRIVKPVTAKVNDNYAKTVGNRSAQARNRAPAPTPNPAPVIPQIDIAELSPIEIELEENLQEELEIEKIKQQEVKQQEIKETKKKKSDE